MIAELIAVGTELLLGDGLKPGLYLLKYILVELQLSSEGFADGLLGQVVVSGAKTSGDCCTVFTPRHPKTHPHLDEVWEYEKALDVPALVEKALALVKTVQPTGSIACWTLFSGIFLPIFV